MDETWLDTSDYRRMKWRPINTTNSKPLYPISPTISMIVALDTLGNVYLSLTQSNTNSQIIDIFFRQLAQKLNKERSDWRNDTVIILDNATYHTCPASLKLFESLRIPIMFTGPHSYDAAPCELFFSLFKSVDFNPDRFPTGKK